MTFSVVFASELAVLSRNQQAKPKLKKIFLGEISNFDLQDDPRNHTNLHEVLLVSFREISWIVFTATFDKLAGNAGCGFYNYARE